MSNQPARLVEIAGMPSAGKSTLTLALEKELWGRGHSVSVMREIAGKCPLTRMKWEWQYTAWILCHAVAKTLEYTHLCQSGEIVIQDRGIFDAYATTRWIRTKRSPESLADADAIEAFATVPEWFLRADLTFLLVVDVETAIRRRGSEGTIVNREVLPEMRAAYEEALEHVGRRFPSRQFITIDTTELGPSDLKIAILEHIDRIWPEDRILDRVKAPE